MRTSVRLTSQGSPHGRFQRALERGNVLEALGAAHELGRLSFGDALGLTVLLAAKDPARYERAAPRWLGRFLLEAGGVELGEAASLASNSLDVFIGHLRRKLEAEGGRRLIHTVRGVGYTLRER